MQMENGGQKRTAFSTYAKPPNIRKAFSQHSKIENSHRTQTNVQQSFSNTACHCELAVQQPFFRKFAVLRQHKDNPFAPIQILTGDTRKLCNFRHSRLHDERRSFQRKPCIERRFESLPGVQRFANLWGTPRSFRTSEKNKIVPLPEVRGSANLDSARRNGGFAQTKLNPLRLRRFENFPFGKFGPIRGSTPCVLFRRLWRHFFLLLPQQVRPLRGAFPASKGRQKGADTKIRACSFAPYA